MAGKKVRLVVRTAGADKQIFSVTGKAAGGLTIAGRAPDFGTGPPDYVKEFKVSVHMSNNSSGVSGRTVHTTITFLSGARTDLHALYPLGNKPFIYPITAKMLGALADPQYDLVTKPNDRVLRLAGFDPRQSCMNIVCYIVEQGVRLPALDGFKRTRVTFSKFDLVIYSTFVKVETPCLPVDIWMTTRPPVIDGVAQPGDDKRPEPLPIEVVDIHARDQLSKLAALFCKSAEEFHITTRLSL